MAIKNNKYSILFLLFYFTLLIQPKANAQSLTGTTGYYNIPSAELYRDKTMFIGASFLNREYCEWTNHEYVAMPVFITVSYLPFMEVSVRFTRALDRPDYSSTVGDRMASVRFKVLNERKYWPSIVVGFQNFFTTLSSGGASHFNSTYVVTTKNFRINKVVKNIGLTAGYGAEILKAADYQFIGFFGGIKITPEHLDFLELMFEYDADRWNAGLRLTILKHIVLLAGFEGLNAFSGGISYKFHLP